ncbi:hypothetical protein BN1051_01359 [Arthrobacter saudimassiliensis]|uniref:Uncharacterized protein n=1 Tax=Arthrobacter saudimassiliensis TaxID=1461584 RepID=A0A078MP17_9MICC|nr:hypothetical protein BN1051_01359 [Arthrobacter saudimassiliensis]
MNIDWLSFLIVAVATLLASLTVVGLFSLGVRLSAVATDPEDPATPQRTLALARAGSYACFAVSGAAVLAGIYLIVPALHG